MEAVALLPVVDWAVALVPIVVVGPSFVLSDGGGPPAALVLEAAAGVPPTEGW